MTEYCYKMRTWICNECNTNVGGVGLNDLTPVGEIFDECGACGNRDVESFKENVIDLR